MSKSVVTVDAKCPHCGVELCRWRAPEGATWEDAFHYVCFNDECPYYVQGWEWMESQFGRRVSYRYRLSPESGTSGPLAVWSPQAMRNFIVDD